ncbi:MAG TPA: DUF1343 domain-containing protein [Methylomirabilota bacterium]|nr:DUF1343 domain-containing protein [Methylomirabilota bacterium]
MTSVRSGLDVLGGRLASLLAGRRVGLLCHPASVTRDLTHAADVIRRMRRVRLAALFAPEHGLAGVAQDHAHIGTGFDRSRRLRVHSLYGNRLEPTPAMLRDLDVLVVDLQDVGARYYTFAWTTVLAMRVCAREGKPVIVLDRPNPLGGEQLEGNWADPAFASFVGLYPLPIRHGMTIAELAAYHNETQALGCDLTVVPMRGWRREMLWEDTELPWVAPSPNMPTPDTARVYPGGCLLEGTNLSEGRGTTRPFEWVGAPYLDGAKLAAALERRGLPGVTFRPAAFEPMFHKWARRTCEGVQVHVTDWDRFRSYAAYLALIIEARRQAPRGFRWKRPPYEFQWKKLPIDLIAGTDRIRRAIEAGTSLSRMEASWRGDLAAFKRARRPFLLYA